MKSQTHDIDGCEPKSFASVIAELVHGETVGIAADHQKLIRVYPNHASAIAEYFECRKRLRFSDDSNATLDPCDQQPGTDETTIDFHSTKPDDLSTLSSNRPKHQGRGSGEQPDRYFGEYQLIEEIARGGMGVVYKARQNALNRTVALKMILAGQFASKDEVQRFQTEAEAAANLDHPGIVPIFEIGQHAGQHFFSMGFVEGQSLADRVASGPLLPPDAAEMVIKICSAIEYAHSRGVIHRDLKPANILLDASGQPKVTDFGLAKRITHSDGLTVTGQILGTPSYMAPEQAAGKTSEVTYLADVYSLGAILYTLLTGRPPFQAGNPFDTLLLVLDQEPVSPRRLNSRIPVEIDSICMKCLEKQANFRYASAEDLSDDLKRFLSGESVVADQSSRWARAWTSMLRETRHTEVMANWGHVWLWHSGQVLVLFLLTNMLIWQQVRSAWPYVALWIVGFTCLFIPVWYYRFRKGVPLTPVEHQTGQVWGMFSIAVVLTGLINHLMGFDPLHLLPVAILECGFAFGCMAAILGGSFFPMAGLCFALSLLLTLMPQIGPVAFGLAFAIGLAIPGWKFSRPTP